MDLAVQLNEILNDTPGYCHWSLLLSFFDKHKNELTNEQKRRIYYRCELYMYNHNKNNPNDIILREETHPYIYSDLSFLEEKSQDAKDLPVLAAQPILA